MTAGPTSLVVMAKAPEYGRVKTRLARTLGADAALQVYRELLAITATAAREWSGPVVLAVDGDAERFAAHDFPGAARVPQVGDGLGPRIAAALEAGLAHAAATVVIGSDCPRLTPAALHAVAALLAHAPVAFGPAADGGFWAIATNDARTAAVVASAPVPWSSADTLASLRQALAAAGLPSALGIELADLDDEHDLRAAVAAGLLRLPPPERAPRSP